MKDCCETDSAFECAVVVSLIESEGFAHESHPPVNGTGSRSVTSSTNGISMPSAFALEYTSLAVGPLAIKRSPSRATHCPEYFSRFSCNHLSDLAERSAFACGPSSSPLDVPFSSNHRRIFSCSAAGSCSIDFMIWSKLMFQFYHSLSYQSFSNEHNRCPRWRVRTSQEAPPRPSRDAVMPRASHR